MRPGWRQSGGAARRVRRPPGHGEAGRAAGRDHRAGRDPAGHRRGRSRRGRLLRQRMPRAVFLGERRGEELAAIYASLDVLVRRGPYKTFGQTLQEAAASGLPVVAPAAGGPLDLVADGVTGPLVPPWTRARSPRRWRGWPPTGGARGVRRGRAAPGPWPQLARADQELAGHYAAVLGSGSPPRSPYEDRPAGQLRRAAFRRAADLAGRARRGLPGRRARAGARRPGRAGRRRPPRRAG